MITLKLLESKQQIARDINKAIADHMNNQIRLKNRKVLGIFKRNVVFGGSEGMDVNLVESDYEKIEN